MALIHYIFVRKDLPLGKLAAMITHAAGESVASGINFGGLSSYAITHGMTAVVLEANDEAHLRRIATYLEDEAFDHDTVVESSEPYANQLMAIGLWPDERAYFGETLSKYQLLKSCLDTLEPARVDCVDSPNEKTSSDDLLVQGDLAGDSRLTQSGC